MRVVLGQLCCMVLSYQSLLKSIPKSPEKDSRLKVDFESSMDYINTSFCVEQPGKGDCFKSFRTVSQKGTKHSL